MGSYETILDRIDSLFLVELISCDPHAPHDGLVLELIAQFFRAQLILGDEIVLNLQRQLKEMRIQYTFSAISMSSKVLECVLIRAGKQSEALFC